MLIIALIGAFVLYVALYFVFEATPFGATAPPSFLVALREMLFHLPDSTPLALLKLGLILFAFYVIIDGLRATVKRSRRNR